MVETATPQMIEQAIADWATLSVPVYLALGNHDLTTYGALDLWFKFGGHLFEEESPLYTLDLGDGIIHVVPTQWGSRPYYWDGEMPQACLYPEQLAELESRLAGHYHIPQILCCHVAPMGIPAAQLGVGTDFDTPPAAYRQALQDLCKAYPSLHVILSGHSHVNSLGTLEHTHWIMASSFSESPFEFKDIEITEKGITIRTVSLFHDLNWRARYDFDAAYVQGRPCDRALEKSW